MEAAPKIKIPGKLKVGEKKRKAMASGRHALPAAIAEETPSASQSEPLALSLPRHIRAYERLRRLQSSVSADGQGCIDAGGPRTRSSGAGHGGPAAAGDNIIKGKTLRRILGAQRLVRGEMQKKGSFDELICIRNAAKLLFEEIDIALVKARERENAEMERRMKEQESTIRWLEMGHYIFAEQKEGLEERHSVEQRELRRQLQEEREKALCLVCLDRARNTLVLPCLHFQYCLDCLLQHRTSNGNTCPTCRRAIEGLCMASSLATQPPPDDEDGK